MSTSAVQSKISDVMTRADELLNRKLRLEEAALERDEAERRQAAAARAKANAEQCREVASAYSDAFLAFNAEVPMPVDGENPERFRARLFGRLARRLPSGHQFL